jgi:hypothetical protein
MFLCITKEDTTNNSNFNSNSNWINLSWYYTTDNSNWTIFSSNSKKTKTTIPIGQICLPILRRHKKTKKTISIGQICLSIPRRQNHIQKTIPIPLGKKILPIFPTMDWK